ncbi:MAG: alpha-L-fucosidase [Prolixibacteraceae bacterium]|nr:alpha-L-fucosidase [Prolixibacteraceae bacterium]
MKHFLRLILVAGVIIGFFCCKSKVEEKKFAPSFQSLEQANPVPEWFKDAKFGIYFHWGVYSVPAYSNEWYPRNMYFEGSNENRHHTEVYGGTERFPYHNFIIGGTDVNGNFVQFAPKLKSEGGNFDPAEWAKLFADAGAKFAGPVAEHHDGFSNWASRVNPWNAKEMGPKLDLVGILAKEIRKRNMKLILSMHHAYNFTGFFEAAPKVDNPKLKMLYGQQGKEKNEELWLNKHREIIDNYKPDIIWQDFNLTALSDSVLLQFLAYYYNSAADWHKDVVATYKDALNPKCAVLDFERGGPTDLTRNYWLTDDAISSSSWCYTEGIGYYSKKQVLHGFLDRISKNGNLLLNISPKADGSIPQEQRDVLLAMGDWLKKFGEAVYATRAWETYGEGPTKMGAAHGVFTEPKEGTCLDIRYTRSKDNTTLYAILLGWDKDQGEVKLTALSSDRIDLSSLSEVLLINGESGEYVPLTFTHDHSGLTVSLPEKTFNEMAWVLKLKFEEEIPVLDKYANVDCEPYYYLSPEGKPSPVLGENGLLSGNRRDPARQWKFEKTGKGIYQIINREFFEKVLTFDGSGLQLANAEGSEKQLWKVDKWYDGLVSISNAKYPGILTVVDEIKNDAVVTVQDNSDEIAGWKLIEVCETKQVPFKEHTIPGTIEVEDFDLGCPGDVYYDKDEINAGGKYRPDEGVDIEVCSAGGFNTGWAKSGEWMAYTVNVAENGNYLMTVFVATTTGKSTFHVEFGGDNITGEIPVMNTGGYQNWKSVSRPVELSAGKHTMRLMLDNADAGLNLDKIVFNKQ